MTPSEVLKFAADKGAKILDLRFMDFPGLWQHLSVPIGELSEELFADGHGFDGSSIRGWQAINARVTAVTRATLPKKPKPT
jgi:glutamine synthetase